MDSCIYEGLVRHSRRTPVTHRFEYRVFMMFLDLDELDEVFRKRWFWSTRRAALARFRRSNYLGLETEPLKVSVLDLVEKETGRRPGGPVRLLTNLSYFGYCFNPVSFYYCYDANGDGIQAIVAEVSNTPWGERDTYVLPESMNIGTGRTRRFQPTKKMHVSPFMPMDLSYDWTFARPGNRVSVYMANLKDGEKVFDASINMTRSEITGRSLARVLIAFPFMTGKVVAAIYWQALKLWVKRCPFYPHPRKRQKIAVTTK